MLSRRRFAQLAALAICLPGIFAAGQGADEKAKEEKPVVVKRTVKVVRPPYEIILRSRSGEVVPERNKNAQTGSGYIDVVQRDPGTVMAVLRGALVAGSETHKGGQAAMHFTLDQAFDIVATRNGLRPPELSVISMLTGVLDSTQPHGGSAEQGPACFAILAGEQSVFSKCIKPHAVGPCQNLFVSEREGPYDLPIVPGCYVLHASFDLSAHTPPIECLCPHVIPAAGAIFDVDPRLDNRWSYVFVPFRAVPHQNFGFGILLRVRESREPLPEVVPAPLPEPRKLETTQLPSQDPPPPQW